MDKIQITQNTTWQEFESSVKENTDSDLIQLTSAKKPSFFSLRIKSFFHIEPPSIKKIESLIKQKIHDKHHSLSAFQLNILFRKILDDCDVKKESLKYPNFALKILNKIDESLIEAEGSLLPLIFPKGLKLIHGQDVQNILKVLLGASLSRELISPDLIKAVFVRKNPEIMQSMIQGLEDITIKLYDYMVKFPGDSQREKLIEILIGNILSIYPYAEPASGSILQVPQKIEGRWHLVKYEVEVLPMTSELLGRPMPAFGLKPQNCPEAHPLLLFRGTPHFTASGAIPAYVADVIPGYPVGEFIYEKFAKTVIQNWINKAAKDKGVKLYGQSLGGSLALTALSRQPDKVSEVHVYGSPGLLKKSLKIYQERKEATEAKPIVHLYWNEGDLVPLTGYFHPDWHIHKVIIPKSQPIGLNHAGMNIGQKNVIMVPLDPEKENQKLVRKVINIFHQFISLIVLPISVSLIGLALTKTFVRHLNFQKALGRTKINQFFKLLRFGSAE